MIDALFRLYTGAFTLLDKLFTPVLLLIVRLWMAKIFFYSGLVKIKSWEQTLYLFRHEYNVPFIDHQFAAFSATLIELTCPILLTLGLFTRAAAVPMLIMALIIQFTYLDLMQHYYWMMLLSLLILKGPGPLSLDLFLARKNKSYEM